MRAALFGDTLDALRAVPAADRFVICDPAEACEALRAEVGPDIDVVAQHGGDLGSRLVSGFADLFRLGSDHVIIVGSDVPDLPPGFLTTAARWLGRRGDRVVLGPAEDGGYYLVGLKSPHPEIFSGIDWGSNAVLEQTLLRARQSGVEVQLVERWHDVDEWSDLERLAAAASTAAPRTRRWFASLRPEARS